MHHSILVVIRVTLGEYTRVTIEHQDGKGRMRKVRMRIVHVSPISSRGEFNQGLAYNQVHYSNTSKVLRAQYKNTIRMRRKRKVAKMSNDVVLIMIKKKDGQVN